MLVLIMLQYFWWRILTHMAGQWALYRLCTGSLTEQRNASTVNEECGAYAESINTGKNSSSSYQLRRRRRRLYAITFYSLTLCRLSSSSSILISGSEAHKTRQTDKQTEQWQKKMLKTYRNKKHRKFRVISCRPTTVIGLYTTKRLLQQFCRRE